MEKTITYLGIERVVYKFSKQEIMGALLERYKIGMGAHDKEFYLYEGFENEEPYAELIIKYSKQVGARAEAI